MNPIWLSEKDGVLVVHIVVQAGARSSQVLGEHNGRLKIRVHAKPVDGQANAQLIRFLSAKLKISKNSVTLLSGETAKFKTLSLRGLGATLFLERIFQKRPKQSHL